MIQKNKYEDIAGQKFGRLTAIKYVGQYKWECICECGTIKNIATGRLKSGVTRSCGCLRAEVPRGKPRHGMHGTTEYTIWAGMLQRCNNSNASGYQHYGGKGIKVCERWSDFANFYSDMGKRPSGCSIDRIDTSGDYEPSNCRWANNHDQSRNTTRNVLLTMSGKTLCVFDWAKIYGIHNTTITARLKRGWSLEDAIKTPTKRGKYATDSI